MLMQSAKPLGELEDSQEFAARHIGVTQADQALMLQAVGAESRRSLMARIVPAVVEHEQEQGRLRRDLDPLDYCHN